MLKDDLKHDRQRFFSSSSSKPVFKSMPGLFGDMQFSTPAPASSGSPIMGQDAGILGNRLRQGSQGGGEGGFSPMAKQLGLQATDLATQLGQGSQGTGFEQQILNMAMNPGAVQLGSFENALLDQAAAQANQRTAVSGLGPATAGTIGSASLPVLANLRQQQFQNLLSGQGGAQAGQQLGLQGQTAGLEGLLQLAGLAMPQVVGGQKSSEFGISSPLSFTKAI